MRKHGTYYIVGHRGVGKSTAARQAARRVGGSCIDLDDVIERREGQSCDELVSDDEERFRRLERHHLERIRLNSHETPTLIVLGAGCRSIPEDGIVVWLERDGWVETARDERARLQPDRPFESEVQWMTERREPRWERRAHLRLETPRGRDPERTARELALYVDWLESVPRSSLIERTWIVVGHRRERRAAIRDAELFNVAGVEVRSDILDMERARSIDETDRLASLRTADLEWLDVLLDDGVAAVDIDRRWLDDTLEIGLLDDHDPRPLIVSAHADGVDPTFPSRMAECRDRLVARHPEWSDQIVVKYAPEVGGWEALGEAFSVWRDLRDRFEHVTCLLRGHSLGWTRPIMAAHNATNYLPTGLGPQRRQHTSHPLDLAWDLQDWLPHLTPPTPTRFDGLVGDPVAHSRGDVWHRRRAEGNRSYLKIPVDTADTHELASRLETLEPLPIRGLSVTSPHKRRVVSLDRVANPRDLEAGNTLRRLEASETPSTWDVTDTDARGMRASLEAIEDRGVSPGDVAIIGTGGVAPALRRALEASAWTLRHHARGREGWGDEAPDSVTLVINAIGDRDNAYDDPPDCEVWLDLHYTDLRPPPDGGSHHLNGDVFFEAQAEAQRAFWASDG